jgi:hypothetical protein
MASKSPPPPFGRPQKKPSGRRPKSAGKGSARYGTSPFARRSRYSRRSQRHGVLFVVVALFLGIAGIAVANAFSGGGSSLSGAQATTAPTPVASSTAPSPTPTATRPAPEKTTTATPRQTTEPQHRHTAEPVVTPERSASASPKATSDCPGGSARLAQARSRLQHLSALPEASFVTAGSRTGTLGTADLASRTVTLYLRSCAEEPASKLAIVWMYEAGQFIDVDSWDTAKRDRWQQLRGASLPSSQALLQDAAAVYSYWQTGSTQSWQSPVPPPSAGQLAELATFLNMR